MSEQKNFLERFRFNDLRSLLLLLLVANGIQAAFTPIIGDEAYYWMWSQRMDWGFFDHPPLVALMINIGDTLFSGTFGMRLVTVLFSVISCWALWHLIPPKHRERPFSALLLVVLFFVSPVFSVYGFITTPDAPLLLFSVLYLWGFVNFQKKASLRNGVLVGVMAAGLMYSKYHGVLLIVFSFLSDLSLLKKRNFYVATLVGLLLYTPHLLWLYENDFATFKYHLVQRADREFKLKNVSAYLLNCVLLLNPLLLGLFVWLWVKEGTRTVINRRLYLWVFWGFLLFFGFSSLRDHVEPQWIAIAALPMLLMLHHLTMEWSGSKKPVKALALASLGLIVLVRIFLMLPLQLKDPVHEKGEAHFKKIDSLAQGRNVVFVNTFQDASLYTYFTGKPAISHNVFFYRKNQYDLWHYEDDFHNRPALIASNYRIGAMDTLRIDKRSLLHWRYVEEFPMVEKIQLEAVGMEKVLQKGNEYHITLTIKNPYDHVLPLTDKEHPYKLHVLFHKRKKYHLEPLIIEDLSDVPPKSIMTFKASFMMKKAPADTDYDLYLTLRPPDLTDLRLSEMKKVDVVVE